MPTRRRRRQPRGERARRWRPTGSSSTPGFGFDDAAAVAPYLAELGVSHLYTSPYLQAAAGQHPRLRRGRPDRVNDELGGEAGHAPAVAALGGRRPRPGARHRAQPHGHQPAGTTAGGGTCWRTARASRYAALLRRRLGAARARALRNTVLLPVLGDHYGRVLEAGELASSATGPRFDGALLRPPLPRSRRRRSDDLLAEAAAARAQSDELALHRRRLPGALPPSTADRPRRRAERHRDKEVLRALLERLLAGRARRRHRHRRRGGGDQRRRRPARRAARAPELPPGLLAGGRREELDYRRFFDITSLVGLRDGGREVFEDTHRLMLRLVRGGSRSTACASTIPTACATPAQYLARLRRRGAGRLDRGGEDPRARRAAAALAGGRHDRLRLPQRGRRPLRRSRR